jgi:hypothetical protein
MITRTLQGSKYRHQILFEELHKLCCPVIPSTFTTIFGSQKQFNIDLFRLHPGEIDCHLISCTGKYFFPRFDGGDIKAPMGREDTRSNISPEVQRL